MDLALASLADARNNMVDGQLRPNKVTDPRILAAMRRLPREVFAPEACRSLAYADAEVPVGEGRVLLSPMVVGRLLQLAAVPTGGSALVLGAGYAAAVLAACGVRVVAVEQDVGRGRVAEQSYARCGVAVEVVHGEFASGWAAGGPYDAIILDGAARSVPALARQLRSTPPARLCAIVAGHGRSGTAVLAERAGDALAQRTLFDCTATVMPELEPAPGFSFETTRRMWRTL